MNRISQRAGLAYRVVRRQFGAWLSPLVTALLFMGLRLGVALGQRLDVLFFKSFRSAVVRSPIIIVGNPRTGTTFLQRFLHDSKIGCGQELWRMLYPSLTLQWFIKPFIPVLEIISPARHHSTVAHDTSLTSVETDDVSVFFRYLDGFFLYGFILAHAEEDLIDLVDVRHRDTSKRDFDWLDSLWRRSMVSHNSERIVAKLFSLGPRLPQFIERFPDAKILYMVRDPVSVIPSGLSLVTGVLDKRFGFWSLPESDRHRYCQRLYQALVELLRRFHEDWNTGKISKEHVFIVPFPQLMTDFEGLMGSLLQFVGHTPDAALLERIAKQAEKQRTYQSKHRYDLLKFGLTEAQIRQDCAFVYDTFLGDETTKS
ncbi:MAG: sulfotransferase family protein [Myxococcota bacterium]